MPRIISKIQSACFFWLFFVCLFYFEILKNILQVLSTNPWTAARLSYGISLQTDCNQGEKKKRRRVLLAMAKPAVLHI